MDGLLLVDKPAGPTSHDIVARIRRALREKRVGHTGTLDPAASGLLAIVLGRATRLARFVAAGDKRYETVIRLGVETDTYDADGVPVARPPRPATFAMPGRADVERALDAFRGTFEQHPPAYSAKKVGGTRSYKLARGGNSDAGRPGAAVVTAHSIDVVALEGDRLTLLVVCSAGFYIRSLAHDLGAALGVGAHVLDLRRTGSGALSLDAALPLHAIEADPERARAVIVPPCRMLPELEAVVLTAEGARYAMHGRPIGPDQVTSWRGPTGPYVRLIHPSGDLIGIAAGSPRGVLHPSVILM